MEHLIATAISSGTLATFITWIIIGRQKKDNLIADTAAKIVEASSATIASLVTRLTINEEKIKRVELAQKECEAREKHQLVIIQGLKEELQIRNNGK